MTDAQTIRRNPIRAAGALLWRRSPAGPEVAVIHRLRYGDWTLPKGKLEEGESWLDAAVREVREETGYDVEVLSFAGAIAYDTERGHKVVGFWHMAASGGPRSPLDGAEVAEVVWLTPEAAHERLQYPLEQNLLDVSQTPDEMTETVKAAPLKSVANGPPRPKPSRNSVTRFRNRWLTPEKYRRLDNALRLATEELELRLSQEKKEEARSALGSAARLLEEARRALDDEGNDALGWLLLKASSRLQIYALTETEVQARARSIVREAAAKLSSWRKSTIDDLLPEAELLCEVGDGGGKGFDHDKLVRVVHAAKILDEHHDNVYLKQAIVKSRLKSLAALALIALLLWLVVEPPAGALATTASGADVGLRWFWGTVFLAGVVGATISGFIFSFNREGPSGIPQELQGSVITFARVALGALSALAVTALFNSGFLNLGKTGYEAALAVAVVSGFSERLLVRAVEAVSK